MFHPRKNVLVEVAANFCTDKDVEEKNSDLYHS